MVTTATSPSHQIRVLTEQYVDTLLSPFHSISHFFQVELKSLFTGTTVAKATEMYLSLLREKGPIKTTDFKIDIPPMEIQTYSLSWL